MMPRQRGFMLIEVLVAMLLSAVALLALASANAAAARSTLATPSRRAGWREGWARSGGGRAGMGASIPEGARGGVAIGLGGRFKDEAGREGDLSPGRVVQGQRRLLLG